MSLLVLLRPHESVVVTPVDDACHLTPSTETEGILSLTPLSADSLVMAGISTSNLTLTDAC